MKAFNICSLFLFMMNADFLFANAIMYQKSAAPVVTATNRRKQVRHFGVDIRGGGSSTLRDGDESEDEYEEEYDYESEEEEDEAVEKLETSAMKAADKSKAKKIASVKSALNSELSKSEKKAANRKKRRLRLPYIVRAIMNPFTVFRMTKAYFASLVNLDYLKKESSQDLRSALEEKAKKSGGGSRGKRKMKPGQAKTLSDLPQLNT